MTVYVDNANIPADVQNGAKVHSSRWCHMLADTPAELHEFAARLGLRRSWAQGTDDDPQLHYDLTAPKRRLAVNLGAKEITIWEAAEMTMSRRKSR